MDKKNTFYTYINYNDKNNSLINYTLVESNKNNIKESVYDRTISDINDNLKMDFDKKEEKRIFKKPNNTNNSNNQDDIKVIKEILLESINNNNRLQEEVNYIKENLNNQKSSIIKEIKDDLINNNNNNNNESDINKDKEISNLKQKNKVLIDINENLRKEIFEKNKQIEELINLIKQNDYS